LILFVLSTVARAAAIMLLVRVPARAVIRQVVAAIPAPHYPRPTLVQPLNRASKAQVDRTKITAGSRL